MEFKTLTSTLVLSFLLAGSQAIAMEKEDKGKGSGTPTLKSNKQDVYNLTPKDRRLLKALKKGTPEESKKAEAALNAKVTDIVDNGQDCGPFLAAISEAMKKGEVIPPTEDGLKTPPVSQVSSVATELTEIDLFTQSVLDPDLVKEMAKALKPGASYKDREKGEVAAEQLRQNALNRKKQKTEEVITPLTPEQKETASWLSNWKWNWNGWFGEVTPPPGAETPKVTVTVDTSSEKENVSPPPVLTPPEKSSDETGPKTPANSEPAVIKEEEASSPSFLSKLNPYNWSLWGASAPATTVMEEFVQLPIEGQIPGSTGEEPKEKTKEDLPKAGAE